MERNAPPGASDTGSADQARRRAPALMAAIFNGPIESMTIVNASLLRPSHKAPTRCDTGCTSRSAVRQALTTVLPGRLEEMRGVTEEAALEGAGVEGAGVEAMSMA